MDSERETLLLDGPGDGTLTEVAESGLVGRLLGRQYIAPADFPLWCDGQGNWHETPAGVRVVINSDEWARGDEFQLWRNSPDGVFINIATVQDPAVWWVMCEETAYALQYHHARLGRGELVIYDSAAHRQAALIAAEQALAL